MVAPRYNFLERLAAGGMAEVYVAEQTNVEGFKKKVAIKRVLPHLSANESFIAMFLDEARLGARLQNANIVSVLDIGATETGDGGEKAYFIVMEYIDGCDLKKVIESSRKRNEKFPLKEAIYIAIEACSGLSHAHNLVDEHGKPCNIVHRDISPPNILLSRDGEVKVTDFGLAKATTQISKTDPGMVKGKFSYLSPEAALGEEVDARADIFALGVVLWEMIAGRRLFYGDTDYQTVKLVQQANIPRLSHFHPDVTDELEAILDRALARDPAKRYQTAAEFSNELTQYIFSRKLAVTKYDIANLVKRTLADEGEQAKPPQSLIDQLIQEELGRFTSIEQDEEESQGSTPLGEVDAGSFENPADWFSDDDFGDAEPAAEAAAPVAPAAPAAPAPAAPAAPQATAPVVTPSAPQAVAAQPAQPAAQAAPVAEAAPAQRAAQAAAVEQAAAAAAHQPQASPASAQKAPSEKAEAKAEESGKAAQAEEKKGGSGLLVAGGVILAAAAAAAYFVLGGG